jgi:hypothetical protein
MVSCEFCKIDFSVRGLNGHKYSCKLNPNRIERISPFKGKTHTEESKIKCRNAAIKQHKDGLGVDLPNWAGKTHKEESKQKISAKLNGNQNGNFRRDRQIFYKGIRMDSNWEIKTAKYFDENNFEWKYSVHSFKLSDGRHYYPDFFIYENGIFKRLVEVKGYFREENKIKFEMFKREYPDVAVELWDGKVLKQLGII